MTQIGIRRFFYIVVLGLGVVLLVGGRGILNIKKIYEENSRIEATIKRLEENNLALEKEIKKLKNNVYYQEKVVREVLGFTRDDEIVYEFNN